MGSRTSSRSSSPVAALMIPTLRSWMRIRTRVRAWARPTPTWCRPGHAQRDGAGLIDAVGADAVVGVDAGARRLLWVGPGRPWRGRLGGAVSGGGGGAALDSTGSTTRSPPKDTIRQLAECLLRQADRYSPREFGIHESDGAPDEKESRPKHEPPGYQACMMRGEIWPRHQESISRLTQAHRAVPS